MGTVCFKWNSSGNKYVSDQASRHHTLNMLKLPEVYGKGTTVSCSSKQDILYTC